MPIAQPEALSSTRRAHVVPAEFATGDVDDFGFDLRIAESGRHRGGARRVCDRHSVPQFGRSIPSASRMAADVQPSLYPMQMSPSSTAEVVAGQCNSSSVVPIQTSKGLGRERCSGAARSAARSCSAKSRASASPRVTCEAESVSDATPCVRRVGDVEPEAVHAERVGAVDIQWLVVDEQHAARIDVDDVDSPLKGPRVGLQDVGVRAVDDVVDELQQGERRVPTRDRGMHACRW